MTVFSAEFHSGFKATLTVTLESVQCVWTPALPRMLEPPHREALLASYRVWRDDCLIRFAREHSLAVQTIHTAGGDAIVFLPQDAAPCS